ncbi:hypothetical protein CORC01_13672 [Colletotrichum orchidophilum]|uniref:RING-type domain-containing protein n=1 Tax=Colletotrichum orchidophilum TaxID=1209926 RepID=A0A1G4APA1_9PEZI|nr:uncharacterized protein CORC01_13672 [Colletotrichum orchidophilum]OHE91018.1 hypothetical protein CORC01_13672 [Colletotrichum orchidophilum]
MEEAMDYAYHHPEQSQGQAQNPYTQQRPRCPYFHNREGQQQLPGMPPHRSTMHYDPVHASANYWQPQGQLPPYQWQPQPPVMNHRGPSASQHRSSNSASDAPYYNHAPVPNFGNVAGGYSGAPPNEMGGPPTMHPSFSHTQLPPVRFGPSTSMPANHPPSGQPLYAGSERSFGGQNASPRHSAFNTASHSMNALTPAVTQTGPDRLAEPQNPPPLEAPESTGGASQAPPSGASIQFGSAPPSATPHRSHTTFLNPPRGPYRSPSGASSSGTSSSSGNLSPSTHPHTERRRVPTIRRTVSRRQSPPSDSDVDSDRGLEQLLTMAGNPTQMARHIMTMEEDHVRAAQFMRGSVTTKYVASSSAIQSLQSVPITDLSESERTCVICYNEFGVETPEGVKEAPLRLPKCKHVFGDHCIKKWFEESDSCPYCRDKVPHEPRITSTNPTFDRYFRNRGHVNLGGLVGGYAGFMRERDALLAQDDANRSQGAGTSHGERRSPPTDSGESRRRIRPRTGIQGPGSPTFSSRPRPVSSTYESSRRPHGGMATLLPARGAFTSSASSRTGHNSTSHVSFAGASMPQHQAPGFGGPAEASSSSAQTIPVYAPPHSQQGMSSGLGMPHGLHGSGYSTSTNRTSLPAAPPGTWNHGNPAAPDDSHRRMLNGDNSGPPPLQASTPWGHE